MPVIFWIEVKQRENKIERITIASKVGEKRTGPKEGKTRIRVSIREERRASTAEIARKRANQSLDLATILVLLRKLIMERI